MNSERKYTILFFADYWDNMWRRRQQIASRLSRCHSVEKVIYIERPLTLTSLLKLMIGRGDNDAQNRWKRNDKEQILEDYPRLDIITPLILFPPANNRVIFVLSEFMRSVYTYLSLRKHLKSGKILVWISHPQISIRFIEKLNPMAVWYDCTEDFSAWPGILESVKKQIEANDKYLTEHADVVSTVSSILHEEKKEINNNTFLIPNAVDIELFLNPSKNKVPHEFRDLKKPVLVFAGAMSEFMHDWDLLESVAKQRKNWTFVMLGKVVISNKIKMVLQGCPNIHCTGQINYRELPEYLFNADICFQFYRPSRENDSRNSQKLFLYLASGMPVVSTPSADVSAYRGLVSVVRGSEEFIEAVEREIRENSDVKRRQRQDFAKKNSWQARIDQICGILENLN